MGKVDNRFRGMMRLYPTTDPDLLEMVSWIPDRSSCKLWAGPMIRFPLTLERLKEDMECHAGNTLSLKDTEKTLLGLGQILKKPEHRIHLARIIVSPESRGMGVGNNLCRLLMNAAEKRYGPCKFSLNVYTANVHAVSLYENLGFKRRLSPMKFSADEPIVYLEKDPEEAI
jgi:ribosomal protein S18 acetylase RimI-like enzyme